MILPALFSPFFMVQNVLTSDSADRWEAGARRKNSARLVPFLCDGVSKD